MTLAAPRVHFDVGRLRLPRYRVERDEAAERYADLFDALIFFVLGLVVGLLT